MQIRVRGLPLLEQYRLPGPGPQRHLLHLDAAGGGLGAAQPRPRLLAHPHHRPLQVNTADWDTSDSYQLDFRYL